MNGESPLSLFENLTRPKSGGSDSGGGSSSSNETTTSLYKTQDMAESKQFYVNKKVSDKFRKEAELCSSGIAKFGGTSRGSNILITIVKLTVRYNLK